MKHRKLALLRRVPQLAVWDDHDFGLNNYDRRHPAKEAALATFRRYWPNPSFGTPEVPGVFFAYRYGGVDFFGISTTTPSRVPYSRRSSSSLAAWNDSVSRFGKRPSRTSSR